MIGDKAFQGTLVMAGLGVVFTLIAPAVFQLFTIINLTTAISFAVLFALRGRWVGALAGGRP